MGQIKIAENEEEIRNCYPVMSGLRSHFTCEDFVKQVEKQQAEFGYRLFYLMDGDVKAVAGIRIAEWLAGGKFLEIEDLVATEDERSSGHGGELFDWIVNFAKEENCAHLKLVSNVKRFGAHRFYLHKRMNIEAHYFSISL